jgi:DNA polymerase I
MSSLFHRLARRFIVPPATKGDAGLRLGFDIEADGLLDNATKVHCIVIADLDGDQVFEYGPEQIADALAHLARANHLIGHNVQNYDLPLLQRLYGWAPPASTKILDTLVSGRLVLPHLSDLDDQVAAMGGAPTLKKLRGRYSLEAWGARLGVAKVGADIKDFFAWTAELQARCVGDVRTTKALWQFH